MHVLLKKHFYIIPGYSFYQNFGDPPPNRGKGHRIWYFLLPNEEYDHSLLYEELEEHFGQLTDKEKSYAKNIFIEEVLSKLIFEGASVWLDSNLKEHKKSIE